MSAANAAAIIAAAVTLALLIARDNSHGYDQANRWGPDYDCSSFLISVWQQVGVAVKAAGATYTGNMRRAFMACGFRDVTGSVNLWTGAGLQPGDVLLNERSHTAMYVGGGQIVHAAGNERGGATGGTPGDQTGGEICERPYYNANWDCVLRYDPAEPEAPASPVEDAQGRRSYTVTADDSLWKIAEQELHDPSRWPEIYELNHLQSTTIHPGQVLQLPPVSDLDHADPIPEPDPPAAGDPASSPESGPSGSFLLGTVELSLPVLERGCTGQIVRSLQALLLNAGVDVGPCGIDGDFGEDTWTAVCDLQRKFGIPVTGATDKPTWAALLG